MEEKRISPRHRVMKHGIIGFNGSGIECLVCNVSESGAAIEIKSTICVPASFNLTVESERINKNCRVVWRKYQRLGVAFISSLANATSAVNLVQRRDESKCGVQSALD
jgi:hypothetical protein